MKSDLDRTAAGTPLGRAAVTGTTTAAAMASHRERHSQKNSLRDVILGGQDGLVNILGIILGVIAGGGSNTVLLAAGFAAAITESISMGAVGYTSTVSERDYYEAERRREVAEIEATPEAERQEIRDIYAAKGFTGDLLDRVVDTIVSNRQSWLATMMDEELHLQPIDTPAIVRSAFVITVATLIGHLIPLLYVPGAGPDPGADPGDRAQRPGALRSRRLLCRDPRGRLADERPEDDGDRPGSSRGWLRDRWAVPCRGSLRLTRPSRAQPCVARRSVVGRAQARDALLTFENPVITG